MIVSKGCQSALIVKNGMARGKKSYPVAKCGVTIL